MERVRAEQCPGCRAELPPVDGPTHRYIGASPACWAVYGQALERGYSDPACGAVLQLVVDAYACQHPGEPERRSAQSVAIHLMTLSLFLEGRAAPRDGSRLHKRMVESRQRFEWLEPPGQRGQRTVASVAEAPSAAAYAEAAWAWARDVWHAWEPHHATVRRWLAAALA